MALASLAVLLTATPSMAATDFTGTATPSHPYEWTGHVANGVNLTGFVDGIGGQKLTCGKDVNNYCDIALIRFDLPITDDMLPAPTGEPQQVDRTAKAVITIGDYQVPQLEGLNACVWCDFDLFVYGSDATGAELSGPQVNGDGGDERVTVDVSSSATVNPDGSVDRNESSYFLVKIPYFTVTNANYKGTAWLRT